MAEGLESLTFPMRRESESASRLRQIISDMLPLFCDQYPDDDILSEYITLIVCNGKSKSQARDYLEAFLGEQSGEFVTCLWELLLKDITLGSSSRIHDDYDRKATTATSLTNEKLISATAPEDVETNVSPKVKTMKMLRQKLLNSPCKRAQPKERDDWNLSGVNYSRKILRSVVVSATKQPCRINPDKYEKHLEWMLLSAISIINYMETVKKMELLYVLASLQHTPFRLLMENLFIKDPAELTLVDIMSLII